MTNIPERIYGPVKAVGSSKDKITYFCVDCSLRGAEQPLTEVYQVSGTLLCKEHAVQWRKAAATSG